LDEEHDEIFFQPQISGKCRFELQKNYDNSNDIYSNNPSKFEVNWWSIGRELALNFTDFFGKPFFKIFFVDILI
jgi:hypothetical protein